MLTDGATLGRDPIAQVTFKLLSGREVTLDLPAGIPAAKCGGKESPTLTPLAQSILDVLATSGQWMFGSAIAESISDETRHTQGSFRAAVKLLKDTGLINSDNEKGYRAVK